MPGAVATPAATSAPLQYYQVAAPLIIALLVVGFVQVRYLEIYFEFAEKESLEHRFYAIAQAIVALMVLALTLSGEAAALEALREGGSVQRENLVQTTLTVELALVGAGVALGFIRNLVRAVRRAPTAVYLASFAGLLAMQELFRLKR